MSAIASGSSSTARITGRASFGAEFPLLGVTMPMMAETTPALEAARASASRYAWAEAFELFGAADASTPLGPDDLDIMAECAWWVGKMRHCIALRERAYAAYLKDGNDRRAARVAVDVANHHADLMEFSVAMAWIQRATKMLDTLEE